MGVPRVWTIERDHGLPLGKWGERMGTADRGVLGGEERCVTGVYDLPCAPMANGRPLRVGYREGPHAASR